MKHKKWIPISILALTMLACFPMQFFNDRLDFIAGQEEEPLNFEERSIMEQTEDAGTATAQAERATGTPSPGLPTATLEMATATPSMPPGTQTALAFAAEGYVEDGIDDGLNCETGEPTPGDLPAGMDITLVKGAYDTADETFIFEIRFGQIETLDSAFYGGIGILNPFGPTVNDPGLIFEDKANHMIYFHHVPDQELDIIRLAVPSSDAGWQPVEETAFSGSAQGNTITLSVPLQEVAPAEGGQPMDVYTFFPLSASEDSIVCDVMGDEVFTPLELPAPPEGF